MYPYPLTGRPASNATDAKWPGLWVGLIGAVHFPIMGERDTTSGGASYSGEWDDLSLYRNRMRVYEDASVFEITEEGLCWRRVDGTTQDARIVFPDRHPIGIVGQGDHTILVRSKADGGTSDGDLAGSESPNDLLLQYDGSAKVKGHTNGFSQNVVGSTTVTKTVFNTAGQVYRKGTLEVWLNGRLDGSAARTLGTRDSVMIIGGRSTSQDFGLRGWYKFAYVWNRALSPSELQLMHQDDAAPFRRKRNRRRYKAPAAATATPHGPLGLPLHGPFAGPFA